LYYQALCGAFSEIKSFKFPVSIDIDRIATFDYLPLLADEKQWTILAYFDKPMSTYLSSLFINSLKLIVFGTIYKYSGINFFLSSLKKVELNR
jgi:hypothetical protein